MPTRSAAFFFLAVALAGCGKPPTPAGAQKAGPYTIQFRTEPDPPHVGLDTAFVVAVTDAGGPVGGASVNLQLTCRTYNQKGPEAPAIESPGWPGHYEARGMTTGVAGQWAAEVTVNDPRKGMASATFPFAVKP